MTSRDWPVADTREETLRTLRIVDDQSRGRDRALETAIEQLSVIVSRLDSHCARHEDVMRLETRLDTMIASEARAHGRSRIWVAIIGAIMSGVAILGSSMARTGAQDTAREQAREVADKAVHDLSDRDRRIAREAALEALRSRGLIVPADTIEPAPQETKTPKPSGE